MLTHYCASYILFSCFCNWYFCDGKAFEERRLMDLRDIYLNRLESIKICICVNRKHVNEEAKAP